MHAYAWLPLLRVARFAPAARPPLHVSPTSFQGQGPARLSTPVVSASSSTSFSDPRPRLASPFPGPRAAATDPGGDRGLPEVALKYL
jgi:hypothetical protein